MSWVDPGIFYDNVEPLSASRLNVLSDDAAYLLGRLQTNNPANLVVREEWFRQYGQIVWYDGVNYARYYYFLRQTTPYLHYRVEGAWARTDTGWWHTNYGAGEPLPRWRLYVNGELMVPGVGSWQIWPDGYNNRIKVWEDVVDLSDLPIGNLGTFIEIRFDHGEGDFSANPDGRPADTYVELTYLYGSDEA